LQEAVTDKTTPGYQDHHIVGQVARKEEGRGFPEWWIDRPENIVRIPTLKHREINGWYSEHNDAKPLMIYRLATICAARIGRSGIELAWKR
jgi:hypothetical protein